MVFFFVLAALMVVAAVAAVVLPIVRPRSIPLGHRDRQNIAIARERVSQLQAQVDAGLVTPAQAEQERSDIELALLDDVEGPAGNSPVTPDSRGRWAGAAMAVAVPVLAGVMYLSLGQPAAFNPVNLAAEVPSAPPSGADIAGMVRTLEQKLEDSPDNVEGWYMLGKSYTVLKQFDKAAAVFQKLRELVGDEPDLLVRQADALAMARNGVLAGEPERLVLQALETDPDNAVALWLAGIAAQRRGDVQTALRYWQRAEPLFVDDPNSRGELQAMIARARQDLGEGGELSQPAERSVGQASVTQAVQSGQGSVKLAVALDDSLLDRVSDQDTLFIFARAVGGPPMPLAVVRKHAGELPLTITLDDSMAMVPEMKLSNHKVVEIIAKVSKSGDAKTRSGDLIGQVSQVTPGNDQRVNVVISKQAP